MRAILLLILGGTLLQAETPNPARQADEYYAKGLAAEKAGSGGSEGILYAGIATQSQAREFHLPAG